MQKRILLVTHATDIIETIPITLELAGHKVVLADCGLDAILWAERTKPHLILVDGALPDMDGYTIMRILRRLPSTADLTAILLNIRRHDNSAESRSGPAENASLHSSELLQEVAFALTLCHSARTEEGNCEGARLDGLRAATRGKSEFAAQTKSKRLLKILNN